MEFRIFFSKFLGFVLLISTFTVSLSQAAVHYHDFVVREKNYTRLCETKSMLVVNGSFPGPTIYVHKGDTLFVNVHNQGDYGFTIHWHGVKQPRNPWSDGPEYITQCPIQPGNNFTYEVIFSSEEGTLWWHAHSDWTRSSIHGAIVIYPALGTTYPYTTPDDEEIIILGSWYKDDINKLVAEDLYEGVDTPQSDSYVINGQPGDFCNCSQNSTYRRVVDAGKTYLFRIINAAMNAELFIAIANHNLTVVGRDGTYVKPFSMQYIVMSPGQTTDILLETNQSPGYYYIAARQFNSAQPSFDFFDKTNVTGILMYSGNYTITSPVFPEALPAYNSIPAADIFLDKLRSLGSDEHPVNVPVNITTRMFIVASMNEIVCPENQTCTTDSGNKLASSLNNMSWVNPSTDILLAYYRNMSRYFTEDFPDFPDTMYNFTEDTRAENITMATQATRVKMLEYNEEVEITFQGTNVILSSENHPMHMHGYTFYVVGRGIGNFDNVTDPTTYNLVDPVETNTFSVPKEGWLTIRFRASNPGVWFWHCHFDHHLSWGMNTVMIVKNGGTPETSIRPPPAGLPICQLPFQSLLHDFDDSNGQVS